MHEILSNNTTIVGTTGVKTIYQIELYLNLREFKSFYEVIKAQVQHMGEVFTCNKVFATQIRPVDKTCGDIRHRSIRRPTLYPRY
jgi:hypothetical protein